MKPLNNKTTVKHIPITYWEEIKLYDSYDIIKLPFLGTVKWVEGIPYRLTVLNNKDRIKETLHERN